MTEISFRMKPTIICVVGESGSGKSFIADFLEDFYDVPMIESRTTRPERYQEEGGHLFVSEEEFDTYKKEEMIAFTTFGEHRYCCLTRDVYRDIMSYVIDEDGVRYLKEHFSDKYNIFVCRVFAEEPLRAQRVSRERMMRDEGRFTMGYEDFDYIMENRYDEQDTKRKVTKMLLRATQKFSL